MKRDAMPGGDLTPPNRFEIEYLEPTGMLSQLVTTFYHFRCDDPLVRDIQPAAVGHLSLFPYGKGRMSLPDGGTDPSHEVNLLTPFAAAAPFEVDGPFHALGAALTPLGWAALTQMHAGKHANRLYDAADWLDPGIARRGRELCQSYREGTIQAEGCFAELGAMIAAHAKLPPPKHLALLQATGDWLGSGLLPDIDDLYAVSTYSKRQTQRLVEQYFGVSPVTLRRKYRALRVAAMLSRPQLAPEEEAAIAEAFYDQPHMIHEIREFVGRTPARLVDGGAPYLSELIDGKNLRELDRSRRT